MLGMTVKNNTFWWFLVSSSSSNLLNVIIETLWHAIMDDEPYILLIDAHAEGNCGNNYIYLLIHPAVLDLLSFFFPVLLDSIRKLFLIWIISSEIVIGLQAQSIQSVW